MKIGIFWYHNHQVIGIAHEFTKQQTDSLGLIDSAHNHVDFWRELQFRQPELHEMEYEQLPRGRAIFDSQRNLLLIYMDKKLHKHDIALQICQFFAVIDVNQVRFCVDPHYKTE